MREVNPEMNIHDFRVTRGPQHTNLIFDVVVPHRSKVSDEEIAGEITRRVQALDPSYYPVFQLERSYVSGG